MDRFDVLGFLGVVGMMVGLFVVHPAWILVLLSWFAINRAASRGE